MIERVSVNNKSMRPGLALALAAGGARGAYHAGAMLGLAERGFRFSAVAGTSIGSLNAAFYAQGDGSVNHVVQLVKLWRSLPEAKLIRLNEGAVAATLASLFSVDTSIITSILGKFVRGKLTLLDPEPVSKLLDTWLDYETICASPIELIVTVLPEFLPLVDIATGTFRKATYLRACEIGPAKLKLALLAAGAIPLAFPSQSIEGSRFSDAGVADPLPARFLYQAGHRHIVSIFLSDTTVQNRSDFPDGSLIQIRPSTVIDTGLSSTFDFSGPTIERLIETGYRDAYESLEEIETLLREILELRASGERIQALADSLPTRRRD
jgi:NTE family protein